MGKITREELSKNLNDELDKIPLEIGDIKLLQTANKQDLVNAINENTSQLAQMETQKANDSDDARTTTNKTVTGAINELNDNKAGKDEVNALDLKKADQAFVDAQFASIVSGAPKGTYATLSALQSAYPTGVEGVFLVLSDGHWYYWNSTTLTWTDGGVYQAKGIENNSVKGINIDTTTRDLMLTGNPLESIEFENGYYSTVNGTKFASLQWLRTKELVPIKPNTNCQIDIKSNVAFSRVDYAFYDKNGNFISYSTGYRCKTPVNASLVGFSFKFAVDVTSNALSNPVLKEIEYAKDEEVYFNVLDKNKLTHNKFITGEGNIIHSENSDILEYIPVIPGQTIRINKTMTYTSLGYDSLKKSIGMISFDTAINNGLWTYATVPNNVYFMSFNVLKKDTNTIQILALDNNSKDKKYIKKGLRLESRLTGKKIACIGDSITWLDGRTTSGYDNGNTVVYGYESYIRQLGADVDNLGHSGAMLAKPSVASGSYTNSLYNDIITNAMDLSGYDIITIFAGTNDVASGIDFGVVGNYGDTEFNVESTFGALRKIIEYIRTNNPTAELHIFTPIYAENQTNRPNTRTQACSEGIKEIAKMYGISVLDLMSISGIGKGTTSIYLYDGTHPNNLGFKVLGEIITAYLNNYRYNF